MFAGVHVSASNQPPEGKTEIRQKGRKRNAVAVEEPRNRRDTETKRQKMDDRTETNVRIKHDPTITVFVSNLPTSVTEDILQNTFPNATLIDLVKDRRGNSRCYGYVEFKTSEEIIQALARDREPLNGRPMFVSRCKVSTQEETQRAFKYSTQTEPNKLFVRGLPIKYTKEDVEELFKPYSPREVRLITQKSGRPKGLAYVDFPDEKMAQRALKALDQHQIGEHTISVAVSAPPPKNDSGIREPVRHARSRLQVPLIPRAVQSTSKSDGIVSTTSKSNDDFRKLFFKK